MEVPQNINRNTTLYRNSISRYLSKGYETLPQKDICTHMFTTALLVTGKTWKQHHLSLLSHRKSKLKKKKPEQSLRKTTRDL